MRDDQELVNQLFKFQIGERVGYADQVAAYYEDARIESERDIYLDRQCYAPATAVIQERHIQECHGGVQKFYSVRRFDNNTGASVMEKYTEFELATLADARAACDELLAKMKAKRNER